MVTNDGEFNSLVVVSGGTQKMQHPIDRAQSAIPDQPLLAVDLALHAFATTRGHRSEPETAQYLDVLGKAVCAATGTHVDRTRGIEGMFDDHACDELSCAALLRLLALDDDAFEGPRLRDAISVFDRVLGNRVYRSLELSSKTQAFHKKDVLRIAVSANEVALQTLIDSLSSLDMLQSFRQDLSKLLKEPLTQAAISPFLPPQATPHALSELVAAAQAVANASDEELVARANAAAARCEELINSVDRLPTDYAQAIVGSLAETLRRLVNDRVRERGLADPAEITVIASEKRYPLHNLGSGLVLRLILNNDGRGQARDVTVSLEGHEHVGFVDTSRVLGQLPTGSRRVDFPGAVLTPTSWDAVLVRVAWTDPDGTHREAETIIDLIAQSQTVPWDDLEYEDPYSLEPVTSPGRFVGRELALRDLAKIILGGTPGNARIVGQRRVGKTSIALALGERVEELRPNQYKFLYVESGDFNANTPEETIERLGEVIATKVVASEPRLASLDIPSFASGLSPLTELFEAVRTLTPDLRFIIVLDEFDAMPHPELYDRSPVATALFQTLRSLGGKPNVGFVVVGGERMRFVIANHGQALNKFTLVPVDYFGDDHYDDYERLVCDPVADWLEFDEHALRLLHRQTAGNPWITKLVAREIFTRALANRDSDIREDDVQAALESVVPKLGASSFQHFWDDAIQGGVDEQEFVSVTRRKVLLGLAGTLRAGIPLTEEAVVRAARQFGVDDPAATDVLRGFREREILVQDGEGRLQSRVPLFLRWLADEGVTEIVVTMGDDDALIRRQRAREAVRPKAEELAALADKWRTYQGQLIAPEFIRNWLNQFGEPPDQRLLLQLLQNLRYFNAADIAQQLRSLHQYVLRDLADKGYQYTLSGRQRFRSDLLVCGLEGGGSGAAHLVKPYRDENRIYAARAVDSANVPTAIRNAADERLRAVLILEDFIGTGGTAASRIDSLHADWTRNRPWPSGVEVYILGICGFETAIARVRDHLATFNWETHLHVAVPLDDGDRCFSDRSRIFADPDEREQARALCFDRGAALDPKNPLGFNDTQAAVCFEARCPNNSLPVLWKDSDSWCALFPRFR
jgi:hypothetical protein